MVNRRRLTPEDAFPTVEIVTNEPQLVPPSRYSAKHKVDVFMAVDYLGMRFRIGDHVAMYNGEGKEWVCLLETLYKDPKTLEAKFKGRWFWSVADVESHKRDLGEAVRPSKCPEHELICCDNRDTNLIESISRKCHILSFDNFQLVRKVVTKPGSQWKKTYFCERQYYHKAHRFSELGSLLFPGDPIPPQLRSAAGLPEPYAAIREEDLDYEEGYKEPEFIGNTKRKTSKGDPEEHDDPLGDPILIW